MTTCSNTPRSRYTLHVLCTSDSSFQKQSHGKDIVPLVDELL